MIVSRFYKINGVRWEARFFGKGDLFPETARKVPRQGVWGRPNGCDWHEARFLGTSWRFVDLEPDLLFLPEEKRSVRPITRDTLRR